MAGKLRSLKAGALRLWLPPSPPSLEAQVRALGLVAPDGLERAFATPSGRTGRAATALLDLGGGERVLMRRLRHGGLLGPLLGELFWGDARPRRELEVTAVLHEAGAPVPRPALVLARRRAGPLFACAIGTFFEEETLDALAFLEALPGPGRLGRAAAAAGAAVRRFHDAGGSHPDLQVKNLLVRETADSAACLVIDLDGAGLHPGDGGLAPAARMRQLMRLYRSLRKQGALDAVGPRGLARFFGAYCAGDRALRRALRNHLPRELRRVALHATRYR